MGLKHAARRGAWLSAGAGAGPGYEERRAQGTGCAHCGVQRHCRALLLLTSLVWTRSASLQTTWDSEESAALSARRTLACEVRPRLFVALHVKKFKRQRRVRASVSPPCSSCTRHLSNNRKRRLCVRQLGRERQGHEGLRQTNARCVKAQDTQQWKRRRLGRHEADAHNTSTKR